MQPTGFRGIFRTDDDARAAYGESAGIARMVPRAVALPADADDIVTLVRWARAAGVPLVPRGSGSSMGGGAVGDGVLMDLSLLRSPPEIDASRGFVRCEAAVTRGVVERTAEASGLRFPVDPSSGAFCTVGGMAATNAAGAHTMRYGAMREWVVGLDCIFVDGSRAWVRRGDGDAPSGAIPVAVREAAPSWRDRARSLPRHDVLKQASGYGVYAFAERGDLLDLLVGSEGSLAIFVGVELALCDAPQSTAALLAAFSSLPDAVRGAAVAREADAAACELLDRTFLQLAAEVRRLPVDPDSEAVLLIEIEEREAAAAPMEARANALERALRAVGATAVHVGLDPETSEALWAFRHAASPMLARLDQTLASMQVVEDGAVPPVHLAEYIAGVRRAIDRAGFRGVIFGHAGDAHIHANALVDVTEPTWQTRLALLFDEVVSLTASLGGTLSGEHGDGRLRTPVLDRVWPTEALQLFRDIKLAFDPNSVLNPGVKLPIAGQKVFGDIKYDRSLPPLPPRARRVLDRVARERAYDRSRLEMLEQEK
jgi:FAD/FMN-containing dehydrogenase